MNHIAAWETEHAKRLMRGKPLEPVKAFFANFKPGDIKILDIGCGAGANTLWLAKNEYLVWAFDGSQSAINRLLDAAISQKAFRSLQGCTVADLTKPWPYKSESFDVALDVRCLENIDRNAILFGYKQACRVLKRGGTLLSITACEHRVRPATVGEARLSNYDNVAEYMDQAGFVLEDCSHWHNDGVFDLVVEAKKP